VQVANITGAFEHLAPFGSGSGACSLVPCYMDPGQPGVVYLYFTYPALIINVLNCLAAACLTVPICTVAGNCWRNLLEECSNA
jgi:hypothetical protein